MIKNNDSFKKLHSLIYLSLSLFIFTFSMATNKASAQEPPMPENSPSATSTPQADDPANPTNLQRSLHWRASMYQWRLHSTTNLHR